MWLTQGGLFFLREEQRILVPLNSSSSFSFLILQFDISVAETNTHQMSKGQSLGAVAFASEDWLLWHAWLCLGCQGLVRMGGHRGQNKSPSASWQQSCAVRFTCKRERQRWWFSAQGVTVSRADAEGGSGNRKLEGT